MKNSQLVEKLAELIVGPGGTPAEYIEVQLLITNWMLDVGIRFTRMPNQELQ